MTLLAVLATALAVALLVPGPARVHPRGGPGRGGPGSRTGDPASDRPVPVGRRVPGPLATLLPAVVSGGLLVALDGGQLALALIVLGSLAAVGVLVRRARRARAASRRRALVVEVCEVLVGELRAGRPLVASLEQCVEVWREVHPVAVAGRLGADVPRALRQLAALPGAEGLREVAAAWQVAERSGAGLAVALGQVAATARQREATRHLVAGELASAQATARLVALLPLASLAMSSGIGGHPWRFLLSTPAGLACLGLGLACAFAGLLWIDHIAVSGTRS